MTNAVPSGVNAQEASGYWDSGGLGLTGPIGRSPPEPSALATTIWYVPDPTRLYAISFPSGEYTLPRWLKPASVGSTLSAPLTTSRMYTRETSSSVHRVKAIALPSGATLIPW